MGFFAQLSTWLNDVLLRYVADNTARIAAIVEPLVATLAILYTIVWGYLQLMGRIEEPFVTGMKKIFILVLVMGVSIHLWLYNDVIVDTFFVLPAELGARLVARFSPAETIDGVLYTGFDVATALVRRGSVFNDNIVFYFTGGVVYLTTLLTALYATFLLTLSRIALSVLLAIGPIFVAMLLFDTTKRFFESWIAQLANYALIALLTTLVSALMMALALDSARTALARGGLITVADGARLVVASGMTLLVMRQVMPMAAGLASGLALSTFGVVSAGMKWAFGSTKRNVGQFTRGLTDSQTTRWDSLSRKAGYYVKRGVMGGSRALTQRQNAIRRA